MKSVRLHAGGITVLALWLVVVGWRFPGPPRPADDADVPPPAHKCLHGAWVATSARYDGADLPAAVAAAISFVFDDGGVTMKGGFAEAGAGYVSVAGEQRYRVTADPIGTIDLFPADGDRAGGGVVAGLYGIERETLTLTLNFAGDRPAALDAAGESTGRFVCERRIGVE